jgi:4-amino-4-deoxychorismate lyase
MNNYFFLDGHRVENAPILRTLTYGEGLFETFRYKEGLPILWDKHMERMERGAALLKIPFPKKDYIEDLVQKAVLESQIVDSHVKLCLLSEGNASFYKTSSESQVLVIVKQYVPPQQSVKLKVNSFRRISDSPLVRVKSTNYLENILARREALGSGFDEALFLNEKDEVTECAASNLFWFKEETLFTASEGCGLLAGVTRGFILKLMSDNDMTILQGDFLLNEITDADFVFITNSLIGCVPVSHIEEHAFNAEDSLFLKIQNTLLNRLKWI